MFRKLVGRARLALLLVVVLLLGAGAAVTVSDEASATTDGFNAGNIISDALFYDGNAMSAAEVQSFLNQRVPRCTIGDPGRTAGMPWGNTSIASKCLRDYTMSTISRAANPYCSAYVGRPSETAAEIITKVAQACGISQRVLLITLEKEQSLVTDSWPTVRQIDVATGYACPDSGPGWSANCNPEYYGFQNQVYYAAWQLKVYRAFPYSYNYRPFQFNTIQYHPNPACGTSQVYIENWATAALYIYTPYRPNAAALAAGWGVGDSCSTYGNRNFYNFYTTWFGSTQGVDFSPVGKVEAVTPGPRQATIDGYAFDPETSAPIEVHYYLGGPYGTGAWGGKQTAARYNATVAAQYPSYGAEHGFRIDLSGLTGPIQVCIYGINVGQGENKLIQCSEVSPASGSPFGNFESLGFVSGVAVAKGWAIDPDDAGAVEIHAYLGGAYPQGRWAGASTTGTARADVQRVYPAYGGTNGFQFQLPLPMGTSDVCLYAIDREGVGNTLLGCRTASTGGGPPRGSLDGATPVIGGVELYGWALDPDTVDPVMVHVYVDGRWGGAYVADATRTDVARAFPGYGAAHGYALTIRELQAGQHTVCVYGIDVRGTSNTQIGCRSVQVVSADPFGSFDGFASRPDGSQYARGWTIDPDTAEPIQVHAYLNGKWFGAFSADISRPDVARAFPEAGDRHGFEIPLSGTGTLCVYAINTGGAGTNPLLGCKAIPPVG